MITPNGEDQLLLKDESDLCCCILCNCQSFISTGKTELTEVKENADGTYSVKYSPNIEGLHSLMVKYADDESYCK